MAKVATIYFSRAGENPWGEGRKVLEKGNTKRVAEFIQQAVGGAMFEIKGYRDYPQEYHACDDIARKELNVKLKIPADYYPSLGKYDVVFIGYPNWWASMPMVMYTLAEHYKFAGKVLIPFCTYEWNGFGESVYVLGKLCPNATILEGLAVRGSEAEGAEERVAEWAQARLAEAEAVFR